MEINTFISELILNLKDNNKNCVKLLEKNTKIIKKYLAEDGNPKIIVEFIREVNNMILSNKCQFNILEMVLKNENLKYIYSEFFFFFLIYNNLLFGLVCLNFIFLYRLSFYLLFILLIFKFLIVIVILFFYVDCCISLLFLFLV